jgi:hypothetical protein
VRTISIGPAKTNVWYDDEECRLILSSRSILDVVRDAAIYGASDGVVNIEFGSDGSGRIIDINGWVLEYIGEL